MAHIMEALEEAEKMLCRAITEITDKGELTASSIEVLGWAIDGCKDIARIRENESGSYERRGRDSMGRYTEGRYNEGYRDGYRDGGYKRPEEREYRRRMDNGM
jgi:hypothetical protein